MSKQGEILMKDAGNAPEVLRSMLSEKQPLVQNMVDTFNAIGLHEIKTVGLLELLGGRQFVNELILKTIPYQPEVAGMKVKREAMLDILEMPVGIPAFENAVDDFVKEVSGLVKDARSRNLVNVHTVAMFTQHYKIVDGNVVIDEQSIREYSNSLSIFAETPEEISLYNKVKELCDLANDIKKDLGVLSRGAMVEFISNKTIDISGEDDTYIPSASAIKSMVRNG